MTMGDDDRRRGDALTRRDVLAGLAALAAGATVAGCSGSGTTGAGGAGNPATSGSVGTTGAGTTPPPAGRLEDVDHVVILMQENRSFDEYYGARRGVRGFGDPKVLTHADGRPVWYQSSKAHADGFVLPYPIRSLTSAGQCTFGSDHSWGGMHFQWGNGKMDGFAPFLPNSMSYYRREDLPYYWALADEFTLCDHWFCSVLGPTLPNRHMAMSGTIDPAGEHGGPAIDNSGTAYTWETYPERLTKAGITWRIYHETDDYDDNALKFYKQFQGLDPTSELHNAAILDRAADAFEVDARAGNLPQVSWIVAPTKLSEHPSAPSTPASGEDYTRRKLEAIMSNPKVWAKTVFILTYDESDGHFDHVPPPVPEPGTKGEFVNDLPIGLGFRIPTTIVSPWSRGNRRVVSDVFDHTSVLRFLETRFGVEVPAMSTWRRETSGDLSSAFDFTRPDTSVPTLPDTVAHLAKIEENCRTLSLPPLPTTQVEPVQED